MPGDTFFVPRPLTCTAPHVDADGHVAAIIEDFHFIEDEYRHTEPYLPHAEAVRWRRSACSVVPDGGTVFEDRDASPPRTAWLAPPPSYLRHERAPAALERTICDAAGPQLGPHLRCLA